MGNIWDDLPIRVTGKERTNFKTQQTISMLERVMATTTNENDIVVDPFCGSGTSLVVAHINSRRWMGCDASKEAIEITQIRLKIEAEAKEIIDYKFLQGGDLRQYLQLATSYSHYSNGLIERADIHFVRNKPVHLEETRHYEFKEVKGNNPISSIANTAVDYAVAFINREGGQIFWGIRNEDRVAVGVQLNYRQRDDVAKAVDNKLFKIQPQLGPSAWQLEFHQVYESRTPIDDLFVIELIVPRSPSRTLLYATDKGEVFVKTDSGKKRLSFTEVQAEIINRLNAIQRHE